MWPSLIQNAKEGGVDVIETYVFWNGHELSPDNVRQPPKLLPSFLPLLTLTYFTLFFLSIILMVDLIS